jgi:hypothetical protein
LLASPPVPQRKNTDLKYTSGPGQVMPGLLKGAKPVSVAGQLN